MGCSSSRAELSPGRALVVFIDILDDCSRQVAHSAASFSKIAQAESALLLRFRGEGILPLMRFARGGSTPP